MNSKQGIYHQGVFFDTVGTPPEDVETYEIINRKREAEILGLFQRRKALSPSQVWIAMRPRFSGIPITSVRRGITVLTSRGLLVKTDRKRIGHFGRPERIWEVLC